MSGVEDPEEQREALLEGWESAAAGWGRRADAVQEWGMPVSLWLVEHLGLHPGERVLELAAGPGDPGFLAAELVEPGGALVCSDGAEAMLEIARERVSRRGLRNVEFKQLQLEWIDMATASVDAVICRWGLMLVVDPASAAAEMRRVLKPGGRAVVAVWDDPGRNPWASLLARALLELGMIDPPDPRQPGMFSLAAPGRLEALLEDAGFVEVEPDTVDLVGRFAGVDDYIGEMAQMSRQLGQAWGEADARSRSALEDLLAQFLAPFTEADGALSIPGRSLVALAQA